MKQRPACELCGGEAALYCEPDAAFLCWPCDASVHGANFLVSRHVRQVACAACHSLEDGRLVSGAAALPIRFFCRSCSSEPSPCSPPSSYSSAASSHYSCCLSTAESIVVPLPQKSASCHRTETRRRRRLQQVQERAERVLGWWSQRMGLRSGQRCVAAAAHFVGACGGPRTALTSRVALAAALWYAIKLFEEDNNKDIPGVGGGAVLRRLEACAGVPGRLIVMAESRIARAARRVRVAEEGWAECS